MPEMSLLFLAAGAFRASQPSLQGLLGPAPAKRRVFENGAGFGSFLDERYRRDYEEA